MKTHELKTWPAYFEAVASGLKTFEIRNNDRGFLAGDRLILKEYADGEYSGRSFHVRVIYVTDFGQPKGQVVMSIRPEAYQSPITT